jgi:hypothetical protein
VKLTRLTSLCISIHVGRIIVPYIPSLPVADAFLGYFDEVYDPNSCTSFDVVLETPYQIPMDVSSVPQPYSSLCCNHD